MSAREKWLRRAHELPQAPGVYLMKDKTSTVVYVGKAKNLRSRVSQYFQEGTSDFRAFIRLLVHILQDIETIVTQTEKEALILERELIRKMEPRFNVVWKDDKQYLCLKVDTEHEWPRVEVERSIKKGKARYFGPFHSATAARQTLRVINRHFNLRTCRDAVLYNRNRPCLEHQIGRCPAPCVLQVDKSEYKQSVLDVILFLEGKNDTLISGLETRMWAAAENFQYEVAARYRDQIAAVRKTLERQSIVLDDFEDKDIFGWFRSGSDICVSLVQLRSGKIQDIESRLFEDQVADDEASLGSFLLQHCLRLKDIGTTTLKKLIIPFSLSDRDDIAVIFSEELGRTIQIIRPKKESDRKLLALANKNAEHGYHEQKAKSGALHKCLEGLQTKLKLRRLPIRAECFDISNLGSHLIVGAQVSFENCAPLKKKYRKYKVSKTSQDDFASMYEVILRRLTRGHKEEDLPDLIVIDGGKGQLAAAKAAFVDTNTTTVDLISLAKSRVKGKNEEDANVRSPERVFLDGKKDPVVLPQSSAEMRFLMRMRDEAHRFGISFHRELRRRTRLRSGLEDLPGVGPTRRKLLLKHFGSLKGVLNATVEQLSEVPGISEALATRLHEALNLGRTENWLEQTQEDMSSKASS